MATKNDPVQLEKEADEALARIMAEESSSKAVAEELITPEADAEVTEPEAVIEAQDSPSEGKPMKLQTKPWKPKHQMLRLQKKQMRMVSLWILKNLQMNV
jgi:hypothetical protein